MESSFDEVIFELDKNLRSGRIEIQLAALSNIPAFLSRTESEIAASTVYLRLADYFCSAAAEQQVVVLRILKQCKEFCSKATLHAEEMVRRLSVIWDSNDVRGRASVLCFYGYLGVAENAEAIWRIQQSLCSIHEEEYESAVLAASMLAEKAPKFVLSIIADAAMRLLIHVGPFSFLHPKLLYILSLPSGDFRLEEMIYASLSEQELTPHVVTALTRIALRVETVIEEYIDLLSSRNLSCEIEAIRNSYLLNDNV
jgi:hypothetical protein